ncbi:MAG: methylated-DNA--[protein]-cysteine S-methyltransferase [Gammaproteobacteria bacterium]|nr:methylated-DNA--[protein]-cysteine S-methyltransferase [Gammaproteobacteria bacterium]
MVDTENKFDRAIWKTVSRIASGRVMSYGEVARVSGYPRHARMVSKAMSRSSGSLPWHRVVRSDRTLAFELDSESYRKQQSLLEKEGVQIVKGKAVPVDSDDDKDLDELLWGLPE